MIGPRTRVYAPAALGGIPDHDLVRAAADTLRCIAHDVLFYAQRPQATQFGWPASVTGAPRNPLVDVDACWQAELTRSLPGGCHSEVHGLDDGAQAAKPAAIGCYRTQVPALLALNARLAEPGTLSYEVTWRPR